MGILHALSSSTNTSSITFTMKNAVVSSLLVSGAAAFPWVAMQPGVDSSILRLKPRQQVGEGPGGPDTCPFNANHEGARPVTDEYPYNNAKDGIPGNGKGGYQVPAPGDTAHQFEAPDYSKDIRGPCPGLNAAANHHFLAHDGIVTFNELVDAQQNVYNVGYDLATLLALLGLTLTDGDIVTQKLSIGCDATSRTSFNPLLTGSEPGLDGHNKFEADTSLTRNDFITGDGDNFSFGPLSLLLFGAASFLYELMPSGTRGYAPDLETISSFFNAVQQDDGTWVAGEGEKIPDNWTNRVEPYSNSDVTREILAMYLVEPVLFGGNTAPDSFDTLNFGNIQDGKLPVGLDAADTSCLLYQLATQSVPSYLNGVITPTVEALSFVAKQIGPELDNLGCPRPLT